MYKFFLETRKSCSSLSSAMAESDGQRPIIIKKIKKVAGGHHGGAWKVAYADFVTAMMAFFLLMWLLNVTTEEAKNAISSYFDPTSPKVSDSTSGAGGTLGGLSMSTEGAMVSQVQPIVTPRLPDTTRRPFGGQEEENPPPTSQEDEAEKAAKAAEEEKRFEQAASALRQALSENPELKELAKNLLIDTTPEGLRIQIVDQHGNAMFPNGSARMFDRTHELVGLIARVVDKMDNEISVRGHTDSAPYGVGSSYTNWDLSADRANSTRAALLEFGLDESRINNVMGKAAREPLIEDDPLDPQNRRISIILLREELTKSSKKSAPNDGDGSGSVKSMMPVNSTPAPAYQRTKGEVVFP